MVERSYEIIGKYGCSEGNEVFGVSSGHRKVQY